MHPYFPIPMVTHFHADPNRPLPWYYKYHWGCLGGRGGPGCHRGRRYPYSPQKVACLVAPSTHPFQEKNRTWAQGRSQTLQTLPLRSPRCWLRLVPWWEGWGRFVWEVELSSQWYIKVQSGFIGAAILITVCTIPQFLYLTTHLSGSYRSKTRTLNTTVNSKSAKNKVFGII